MPVLRKPFICECGEPGIKRNSCKEPVCFRCASLEAIRGHDGNYAKNKVVKVRADFDREPHGTKQDLRIPWFDTTPVLYPDAIARIDRLLAQTSTAVDAERG